MEENLVGNAKYDKMNYDMVSMMMICLGQPDSRQEDIIHLLSVLLSTKWTDVKKRYPGTGIQHSHDRRDEKGGGDHVRYRTRHC